MNRCFHFTLGPVQGFVAQARRTRDLWAGSFLLSWLAGQALADVRRQGGEIVFPAVADAQGNPADALLAAIERRPLPADPHPQIGSLPNRFKATVPTDFDPAAVSAAVQKAWSRLAQAVWHGFVSKIADQGHDTETIWQRQIAGFWDIAWVLDADPGDGSDARWLEARKNWRSRWPAPEGGDHCVLMSDWQEISGYVGARDGKQRAFWAALAARTGALDLRDNERLCAIALVKRLFPKLPESRLRDALGWIPGGNAKAVGNWPSTAYLAAIPWLRGFTVDDAHRRVLADYSAEVEKVADAGVMGERATQLPCLQTLGRSAGLDGNFFHANALANAGDTPFGSVAAETQRAALLQHLKRLKEEIDSAASPWYALLLLDGDRLGKLLADGGGGAISQSLGQFSRQVAGIVHKHDGVTVYAGGDDVLALLSMDRALDCAQDLRRAYGEAFKHYAAATASASIVYAHYHLPLRQVLQTAHHQLDAVAKVANGRDSLALAWLKSSGPAAQWVATWSDTAGGSPVTALKALADGIRDGDFSTSFFYHLRARYPLLAGPESDVATGSARSDMNELARAVLLAEYRKSRERSVTPEIAEQRIDALLAAASRYRRNADGAIQNPPGLQLDALRIARLLAGEEERE